MNLPFNTHDPQCGVVIKKSTNTSLVQTGSGKIACGLSSRLRKQARADLVAIGDEIRLVETAPGYAEIVEILPRRNRLSRRSAVPMPSAYAAEQVIAANVDQVVPVFAAAHPTPSWGLLDRALVSAESSGIPALVCITKTDLLEPGSQSEELQSIVADYRRIGYPVVLTSAANGAGLDEFKAALRGKLSLLIGKSGVGKSSLLNAIQPGLGLKTQTVSQANDKGRHTTSHLEMFPLACGGSIIDTPGIREFGLWDVDEDDLAQFFPEMRPFIGICKFGLDCRHDEEPGCAIRKAVSAGEISPYRYRSYLKLKELP